MRVLSTQVKPDRTAPFAAGELGGVTAWDSGRLLTLERSLVWLGLRWSVPRVNCIPGGWVGCGGAVAQCGDSVPVESVAEVGAAGYGHDECEGAAITSSAVWFCW
jgi:hypothetical protein